MGGACLGPCEVERAGSWAIPGESIRVRGDRFGAMTDLTTDIARKLWHAAKHPDAWAACTLIWEPRQ